MKVLGERLRELRAERGLSRREVAEITGIAYARYNSYERGDRNPRLTVLRRITSFYRVSCDYLVGLSDTREPKTRIFSNKHE